MEWPLNLGIDHQKLIIFDVSRLQDYREVMNDYKVFHVVVMKQDIRTLLVSHIGKKQPCFNNMSLLKG